MVKVRVQLVPEFGPRPGEVKCAIVVESSHTQLLKAVHNKLQLKKKDVVTLYCEESGDLVTRLQLPEGDLSRLLKNDMKIIVCSGEPKDAVSNCEPQLKMTKKLQKVLDHFQAVPVTDESALAARGRPNPATLIALRDFKGVSGVVTLLRDDEGVESVSSGVGAAALIAQTCEKLDLKWWHLPLAGPKRMGLTSESRIHITTEDLESFRRLREVAECLKIGRETVVVHCAAGLHRTGIALYLLLRTLGYDESCSVEKIQQMRQATFEEFVRLNLQPKVESIFHLISDGLHGNSSGMWPIDIVKTNELDDSEDVEEAEHPEKAGDETDEEIG